MGSMKATVLMVAIAASAWGSAFADLNRGQGGFLNAQTSPDSTAVLPAPPAEDTVAFQADKARYETGRVLRDADRVARARQDADYANVGQAFSESFGLEISPTHTPALYQLLQGVLQDSHDYAVRSAKNHYKRVRPFVVYKEPTCTPELDETMAVTGSYPSGHASFGWAVALVLSEINPARQTQLLQRGYDFGISRVVCGAHWQSDVQGGQLMGAALVAALHANGDFMRAMSAAKSEFAALHVALHK